MFIEIVSYLMVLSVHIDLVNRRLKNKHSAVESNINELEQRGMDKCPDRSYPHFKRYIGLSVSAYNLRRIGKKIIEAEKEKLKDLVEIANVA